MNIPIASAKYVITFILFIFLKNKGYPFPAWKQVAGLHLFVVILICAIIRAILDASTIGYDGVIYCKNFLWYPILLYIFFNVERCTCLTFEKVNKSFVDAMCFYVVVNFILYYIPIPFLITQRQRYWGRVTVGYPTIDVILITLAFALLFLGKNKISVKQVVCQAVVLFVGLCAQASGTSIILLAVVVLMLFFFFFNIGATINNQKKIAFVLLLTIIFLLGSSAVALFKSKNTLLFEDMYTQIESRAYVLLGKDYMINGNLNTMDSRKYHFKRASERFLNTEEEKFLGVGYGRVSMKQFDRQHIVTEDQFSLNKVTIGMLGNGLYVCLFFTFFLYVFKFYKKSPQFPVYLTVLSFFIISSFTSNMLLSFGPIGIWTLFYSSALVEQEKRKI